MEEPKTQEERLDYLVREFKNEDEQFRQTPVPETAEEKKLLLRAMMNVRMPRKTPQPLLKMQNDYLAARLEEIPPVPLAEIKTIKEVYGSELPAAGKLSLWQGDITRLAADAIVNAANSEMLGCFRPLHACIDNCIHTYAGVQLRAECAEKMAELRRRYGNGYLRPTAAPLLTDAYNLPAKHVIHVVGPIVTDALTAQLEEDLANCYKNTLDLCAQNNNSNEIRNTEWIKQITKHLRAFRSAADGCTI